MNESPNARLFIWFRIFFNCRFYYPIFTILFLDLGLSIGEFAAMNVVWALTSVVLEVPSGALADRYGRRPLVVGAGVLMVLEMIVLVIMPAGRHDIVLWLFVLNRVFSGAAEALASGADEALAYDSLPEGQRERLWPQIMARLSRAMALGFVVSSISGSVLYDHTHLSAWVGIAVPKALAIKLPIMLCIGTSIACLVTALRMKEDWIVPAKVPLLTSIRETWASILRTGGWIWRTKAAFALILFGLVFDCIIRLFLTVTSNFYRLIHIEEFWFGVIGTGVSLLGLFTATLMEKATQSMRAVKNFSWLALLVLCGLFAAAYPVSGWVGVLLVVPLFMSMRFLQFFLSHYMNAVVSSQQRATALSFRGLTTNLAYGLLTLLFGWHTAHLAGRSGLEPDDIQVFASSLHSWPWFFLVSSVLAVIWMKVRRFSPVAAK